MDYSGKLCVLGTFDTICSQGLPVIHPQCALALRICFKPEDEGKHIFSIRIIDADGKDVIPAFQPNVEVRLSEEGYFVTRNLILNLQRLKFDAVGQYSIDISVDGSILTRVPLRVMLLDKKKKA